MPVALTVTLEVDTLPTVTSDSSADSGPPDVYTAADLAERWGVTRSYVHQLRGHGSPLNPPLPEGSRVGRQWGQGTMVWTQAQVDAFEAVHADWVALSDARRVSQRGRRPSQD